MQRIRGTAWGMFARAAVLVGSASSVGLMSSGCGWAEPKQKSVSTLDRTPAATFDYPPQHMAEVIKQALAAPPLQLPIDSEQNGTIVTGWKAYRGDLHIVRYWYEQTRFHIQITPDFSNPTQRCRVQVFDETEERAAEQQPWYPAPNTHRPERAEEVLKQIQQHARP